MIENISLSYNQVILYVDDNIINHKKNIPLNIKLTLLLESMIFVKIN